LCVNRVAQDIYRAHTRQRGASIRVGHDCRLARRRQAPMASRTHQWSTVAPAPKFCHCCSKDPNYSRLRIWRAPSSGAGSRVLSTTCLAGGVPSSSRPLYRRSPASGVDASTREHPLRSEDIASSTTQALSADDLLQQLASPLCCSLRELRTHLSVLQMNL
jgi:hypothetical protein